MRILACLAVLALPATAPALTLGEALDLATKNDPELRALQAEREATERERAFAGRMLNANPELGLQGGPAVADDDTGFEYAIWLVQPLRLGGQGRAQKAAVDAALLRDDARLQARHSALRADVRSAFARVLAARDREALARESATLAQEAAEAAQQRFEAGRIPRVERNGARVEQARAAREAAQAAVATAGARAELRALLGLARQDALEVEGTLSYPSVPGMEAQPSGGEAPRLPALEAARLERQEALARRDLADASAIPDLRVGGAFEHEVGVNKYFATLSIPLPLFDRNDLGRAEASRELARSEAALAETERRTTAELERAAARLDASGTAILAYEAEALDALRENLELATRAYREGDVDFTSWLLLRRDALDGRRAWIDALEELALAQAAWDRALGR